MTAAMNAVMLQTYWRTNEYIVEYEQNGSDGLWGTETVGRTPAPFVRFIRDRVCETQKGLLRLMGQSIALDDEDAGDRVNGRLDDRVNDRVNDGIAKYILDTIVQRPGVRTNEIATHIGKSIPTVSRHIKILKDSGKSECRGAPKNGGYFAI